MTATPLPPPTPMPVKQQASRLEPVDLALLAGLVFFVVLLIVISKWSPNDGQTFQVVSGLVTGFAAAFLARMKPAESKAVIQTDTTARIIPIDTPVPSSPQVLAPPPEVTR